MVRRYDKLPVLPEFKALFKSTAAKKGMTMIQMQENMLEQNDPFFNPGKIKSKKKQRHEIYI